MSFFVLLSLCIQACLVQNVFSQGLVDKVIGQGMGLGSSLSQIYGPNGCNSQPVSIIQESEVYGGTGVGEVVANGILPVEGYTSIAGQVPIIGIVRFDGRVQAKGSVSISGSCGCGCQF